DKALKIYNNKVILNKNKCLNCGKCIKECSLQSIYGEEVEFSILIGGRMGRKVITAKALDKRFKEEDILIVVEKIIKFYEENANKQERFANLIERIGFEKIQEQILNM
ncbi:MAG: (4Fe-4S)-binding protein, partial [Sarcina sp.]